MTRLAAAVLTVAACAMVTASTARAAPAFMSCGFNDAHGPLTYKQRPARCHYSSDGSTANLINLVGIRWTNWGQLRATGAAWRVDNHDQDWNGFQRHPVKVVVSGLRPAVGDKSRRRLFYTRLTVVFLPEGKAHVWKLRRPVRRPSI